VSAHNFEAYNLLVRYYTDISKNWSFVDADDDSTGGNCKRVTQKCYVDNNMNAHFCVPFETRIRYTASDHDLVTDNLPIIHFNVLSLDYLNRLICNSYGYIELANKAGTQSHSIITTKPSCVSITDELRQYFIGYAPNAETVLNKKQIVSKYGEVMEASGTLNININTIIENDSANIVRESQEKLENKYLILKTVEQNIMSIVSEFQKAKRRMDSIRREIKNQIN